MAPKRGRKVTSATPTKKSSMEESADALAGVEGALTGDKPSVPPKKRSKQVIECDASLPDLNSTTTASATDKRKNITIKSDVTSSTAAAAAVDAPELDASVPVLAAMATKEITESKSSEGKKAQISYNPDINMTKEQLTAWRREMRRVRNRESAAASRRKVRERIEELEEEVDIWKKRYAEAMAKLGEETSASV